MHFGTHIGITGPSLIRILQTKETIQIQIPFQLDLNVIQFDPTHGRVGSVACGSSSNHKHPTPISTMLGPVLEPPSAVGSSMVTVKSPNLGLALKPAYPLGGGFPNGFAGFRFFLYMRDQSSRRDLIRAYLG